MNGCEGVAGECEGQRVLGASFRLGHQERVTFHWRMIELSLPTFVTVFARRLGLLTSGLLVLNKVQKTFVDIA